MNDEYVNLALKRENRKALAIMVCALAIVAIVAVTMFMIFSHAPAMNISVTTTTDAVGITTTIHTVNGKTVTVITDAEGRIIRQSSTTNKGR